MSDDRERREKMLALIERSSLGTEAAKKLRARTPRHVVDEIMRRVRTNCVECGTESPDAITALFCSLCAALAEQCVAGDPDG